MSGKRIYFLRPVGQIGPIKIGCSKLPEQRLDGMAIWSPVRLEIICSVPGSHRDEKTLHCMFAKHLLHHEWFGASKEVLQLVAHCEAYGVLPELPKVVQFPTRKTIGFRRRAQGMREPGTLPEHKMEKARQFRAQHESGLSAITIAKENNVTAQTVRRYIRIAGGEIKRGRPRTERGVIDVERADEFKRRYLAGETLKEIGDAYGLTRERVRQILRKTNVRSLGLREDHKRTPHELTEVELLAVEMYSDGKRPSVVIAETGLTQAQLHAALLRCGVPIKGTGYWLTRPDDAEITERVCDLYRKGFSAPQIVARVPQLKFPETVYRYLKKGNCPVRNPWMGNFSNHGRKSA